MLPVNCANRRILRFIVSCFDGLLAGSFHPGFKFKQKIVIWCDLVVTVHTSLRGVAGPASGRTEAPSNPA